MGYNYSERRIRNLCGTDKLYGTDEKKLFKALKQLGFKYKIIYNRSESAFKQRILYNLKKNNKLILLTDNELHWISVIEYKNKKITIIDPQEARLKQELTLTEL